MRKTIIVKRVLDSDAFRFALGVFWILMSIVVVLVGSLWLGKFPELKSLDPYILITGFVYIAFGTMILYPIILGKVKSWKKQ
ncbi:MAG: hypothetical protein QXS81_04310 [Candidatus Micrarchaeaceae archaeon]